ncbi:MAG: MlaD family protein [Bacteroidota bacterium]
MSKEVRIGIISIAAIAVMIWGFQYLKGKNILSTVYTYEAAFPDVEGLYVASNVEINGLRVGSVSDITLNPEDLKTMVVTFDVEGEYGIPKDAVILNSFGTITGGKKIVIQYDALCSGDNCAPSGHRFSSGYRGMLQAMMGDDGLGDVMGDLRENVGPMVDTLMTKMTGPKSNNAISNSLVNLERTSQNLASLTANLDRLLSKSYTNLNTTIENVAVITRTLANTNTDIEKTISNFAELSDQLVAADLDGAMKKTTQAIDNASILLEELQTTVSTANTSFEQVNSLLTAVESGEGTIAKLLQDPEIYYNLEATTKHLSLLLQDLRLNPRRYVNVSVFGKKDKAYIAPEGDPAMQNVEVPSGN